MYPSTEQSAGFADSIPDLLAQASADTADWSPSPGADPASVTDETFSSALIDIPAPKAPPSGEAGPGASPVEAADEAVPRREGGSP